MRPGAFSLFAFFIITFSFSCGPGTDAHTHTNRLIHENSPYLRQHAHNPVDWHPWGEEALNKARAENKMIIVSIGYAACHWCHVMERESFEDSTVARIMNEHFVSIKVDREERPDVDDVYMTACLQTSERGCGWPLNAFALPDGQPVWTGTYAPKKQWLATLEYFAEQWRDHPERVKIYAGQLTRQLQSSSRMGPPAEEVPFQMTALEQPLATLLNQIDLERGGRRGVPKFPMPNNYEFLLRYFHHTGKERALEAVKVTLDQIAAGGIYDQLGGGFARYATDTAWLVPHFEKMLYDNAQLVSLYAHACQATGEERYRQVVEETLEFVSRELSGPEGAFFSSLDADSDGEEGRFYVWRKSEIDSILIDPAERDLFCRVYGVSEKGNWEGKNILHLRESLPEAARQSGLTVDTAAKQLRAARQKLLNAREQRTRPNRDEKVLTSWNALMLQGLTAAFAATGQEKYREMALQNGIFLRDRMIRDDFRLWRNYMDGQTSVNAFLDDYAQTILAFIRLYEITFEEEWLYQARGLAEHTLIHFRDTTSGLFFYTSDLDPPLVVRKMETEDNVIPGSNSSLARGLFYLGQYFYNETFLRTAGAMAQAMHNELTQTRSPDYFTNWYTLWMDLSDPPFEVAIVGPQAGELRDILVRSYLPNTLLLGGKDEGTLELLKNKHQEDQTVIYVCRNKVCKLPVTEVDKALELIN